jgi:hypothetical protein
MNADEPARGRRIARALIGGAALLGLAWLGWWSGKPDYIELDIPVPLHSRGIREVWWEEMHGKVRYSSYDERGGLGWEVGYDAIVRRRGVIKPDDSPLKSERQILDHLDRWLTAQGWVLQESGRDDPASRARTYRRPDDPLGSEGGITVEVRPDAPWYDVIVASSRPSFLRRLDKSVD